MLPAQAQKYTLTDLGTLGGANSTGLSINNAGQVTGYSTTTASDQHAFFYSNGTMIDLGTRAGSRVSQGWGINSSGQVTGYSTDYNYLYAFVYSNGTMTDLSTALGAQYSYGSAINNSGQIVGAATQPGAHDYSAFIYNNGAITYLGTLGGKRSIGYAINSSGQVTGLSDTTASSYSYAHAFLFDGAVMRDLGTLGGAMSEGHGINDAGHVVGFSYVTGNAAQHAFVYDGVNMTDLGTLGGSQSLAYGLNNGGEVVGESSTTNDAGSGAFLYSNSTLKDLNAMVDPNSPLAPFTTLQSARAINDNGWIVANGYDSRTTQTHAYLLTPEALTVPFASFYPLLAIHTDREASFVLDGYFFLGSASAGVDPTKELVTVGIGMYSATIPAGSFKQMNNHGLAHYQFIGVINGAKFKAEFWPLANKTFTFLIEARRVQMTEPTNPVSVTLTIGRNSGTRKVAAMLE